MTKISQGYIEYKASNLQGASFYEDTFLKPEKKKDQKEYTVKKVNSTSHRDFVATSFKTI